MTSFRHDSNPPSYDYDSQSSQWSENAQEHDDDDDDDADDDAANLAGNPKYSFFYFSVFPPIFDVFDRFRLNGYHHLFPLIEIYRFMQLPSRTDDINFIFDCFSVFSEIMFFVFDDLFSENNNNKNQKKKTVF